MKPRKADSLRTLALVGLGSALVGALALPAGAGAVPAAATPAKPVAPIATVDEVVYVSAPMDSDGDGQNDKIAAHIRRPADSGPTNKVPVFMRPSPYYAVIPSPADKQMFPIDENHVPGHLHNWMVGFFNDRGYAVVEAEMQGTGESEGCPTSGGPEDTKSIVAVVDWLNGRATATHADNTPAVADWATGNVGMMGLSYEGTLPIAAASTGVAGLKTIVSMGAISSWYDYQRSYGIKYGGDNYSTYLANFVANSRAKSMCTNVWAQMDANDADADAVYNSFWAARDYRPDANKINASVWLVHGQRDDNVRTKQYGAEWSRLAQLNKTRRLWLHDGAHADPFGSGDATMQAQLARWFDHYVKGISSGATSDPAITIDRPDGTRNTYSPSSAWPLTTTTTLNLGGPAANAAGSLVGTPVNGSQTFDASSALYESTSMADPNLAATGRLAYLTTPLTAAARLSGSAEVTVKFTATATSSPLTAILVDYNGNNVVRRVTRGTMDLKNMATVTADAPLVPGQQYTTTLRLEPRDYVFPAGDRLGLIVQGNDPSYMELDPNAGNLTVQFNGSTLKLPGTFTVPDQCSNYPAYSATTIYQGGETVSFQGHIWKARWYTMGVSPAQSGGQWGVWEDRGPC